MPVKRRISKRRLELDEDTIAWLEGRPSGFVRYRIHSELLALWDAYGDERVATWDRGKYSKPIANMEV